MKKYIVILLVCSLFFVQKLDAQQDPMFSQYMFNTLSLNPAYAGTADMISTTLISRHQWVGLKGAPQTQTYVIHSPIGNHIAAGISIIRDIAGPISNLSFQANASYYLQINNVSKFYFGLMAGANNVNSKLTEVGGVNIDDFTFQENLNVIRPIFGFGLYYKHPKAYAGFSVPDLVETSYSGNSIEWKHKRHFYFIGGYLAEINDNLKLRPTIMARYTKEAPVSVELTSSLIIRDLFWLGALYRFQDAVGALLCIQINPKLRIGYSYDYSLNLLRGHQGGSHEIMLSYDFNFRNTTYTSPRYF